MTWLSWLQEHWFDTLQTLALLAGFAFTAVTLRRDERSRRVQNLFRLTAGHRELWAQLGHDPALCRILAPAPNLALEPVTEAETRFVGLLMLHLNTAHHAIRNGVMDAPDGLGADVRDFFTHPLPRAVWEKLRPLQDASFVAFVESHLDKPLSPSVSAA
jgi:hypothetical protein